MQFTCNSFVISRTYTVEWMSGRQPIVLLSVLFFIMLALAMYLARVADGGEENVADVSVEDSITSDFDEDAATAGAAHAMRDGVEGEVVDATGKAVAGALIQPVPIDGSGPVPDMAVVTDVDGRFVWRLRPGRYRLEAILGGRVIAKDELAVTKGTVARIRLVSSDQGDR